MRQPAAGLLCALALAGCAIFKKSEPLSPTYYSAERFDDARERAASPSGEGSAASLRLARVEGASHLRERIAYRTSPRQLGFYETRRWAERPEVYLRRALSRALFEQRGMIHTVSGLAPALEVELIEFDEWRGPPHRVRVRAHVLLSEARSARFEHTVTAEQPVRSEADEGEFAEVAEAFSIALGRVVDEVSDRVVAELQRPKAASGAEPPTP